MTEGPVECCLPLNSFPIPGHGNNTMDIKWPINDVDFTVHSILAILASLKFTFLSLITDRRGDSLVNALLLRLNNPSLRTILHVIDEVNSDSAMESYVSILRRQMDETLSVVLCGDPRNTLKAFTSLNGSLDGTKQSAIEHHTRWLAVTPKRCLPELENKVSMLDNIFVVAPTWDLHSEDKQKLGVYTMHIQKSSRRLQEIGFSSRNTGLLLNDTHFPNIGHGFNGRHFIIGIYVWDPFTMRITGGNNITYYEGFCVDLVIELSRRLNFTFTLTEPPDNNWGSPRPDGSWTGLVGMLQESKIDISVAAMIITKEREEVMDGSFPFYYDHVGVLYKRLDPEDSMWKTYFHPFKKEVFLWFGASLVLGCMVYLMFTLLSPTKSRISHNRGASCTERIADVVCETDNIVSSVFQQGRPDLPLHCSGRVFLSFWWLFVMIIAATYKGNLIAFFMVPQEDVPFMTLYDLATQNIYRWGVTGSTVVEHLFKVSQRPDFKLLGQGIERFKASDKNINSLDPLVHLAMVKSGHYAYISDMVPMEIWMSEYCELRLLHETVIPLPFVVGLHNNSGFLSLFNQHLLEIDQIGLYYVWKRRWWPQLGKCTTGGRTAKKILSVVDMQSSFYSLCLGIALSTVCLLGEHFVTSRLFKEIVSFLHTCCIKIQHTFFYQRWKF